MMAYIAAVARIPPEPVRMISELGGIGCMLRSAVPASRPCCPPESAAS